MPRLTSAFPVCSTSEKHFWRTRQRRRRFALYWCTCHVMLSVAIWHCHCICHLCIIGTVYRLKRSSTTHYTTRQRRLQYPISCGKWNRWHVWIPEYADDNNDNSINSLLIRYIHRYSTLTIFPFRFFPMAFDCGRVYSVHVDVLHSNNEIAFVIRFGLHTGISAVRRLS